MNKTYQPIVVQRADEVINSLQSIGFFIENEIDSTEYMKSRMCDNFTVKFIAGELDEECPLFDEKEFKEFVNEVIVHSILERIEKKGFIGSYEDDDVEQTFFMTEKGVNEMKRLDEIGVPIFK